jgi:hypothetical protein
MQLGLTIKVRSLSAKLVCLALLVGAVQLVSIAQSSTASAVASRPCTDDDATLSSTAASSTVPNQGIGAEVDGLMRVSAPGSVRCLREAMRTTRGRLSVACVSKSSLALTTYVWYMCGVYSAE